ncbi:MAG TPA: hypothetical protein VFB93_26005 [Burkholderiales bacterium]|nr:hypothetical protein [Burkholderiales bacterium]
MKMELGIRLRDSGKLDVSFNGIPVRATESAHMTCPPPPQSCAGLVGIMAAATAASLVLVYAVSRNR